MKNAVPQIAVYDRYQRSMVELVERVRAMDVGGFETATCDVLWPALKPRATTVLDEGRWLRSAKRLGDGAAPWRDVCAGAGILRNIALPQQLLEHDTAVIRGAQPGIAVQDETRGVSEISKRVFIELGSLEGLDDHVASLVRHGELSAAVRRPVTERLAGSS